MAMVQLRKFYSRECFFDLVDQLGIGYHKTGVGIRRIGGYKHIVRSYKNIQPYQMENSAYIHRIIQCDDNYIRDQHISNIYPLGQYVMLNASLFRRLDVKLGIDYVAVGVFYGYNSRQRFYNDKFV